MTLVVGREPRKTAGNRMSKLLDAEEEDEFYKTTYGGFNDESGDDEYHGEHSDTEDEVDSDFDIDEGDEPDSDQEEDAPRRKSRVVTKAYKEPIKVQSPNPKDPLRNRRRLRKLKWSSKGEFHKNSKILQRLGSLCDSPPVNIPERPTCACRSVRMPLGDGEALIVTDLSPRRSCWLRPK